MERIHFDRVPLQAPLYLNPVMLLQAYRAGDQPQAARFATGLTINYAPKDGTSTPGQVIVAFTRSSTSDERELASAEPKLVLPIWKPGQFHIPLAKLNPTNWSTADTTCFYLSSNAQENTLFATFTLVAHGRIGQKLILPEPTLPPPYQLSSDVVLNYQLVGMSYAQRCCNPLGSTGWIDSYATLGYTMNVDMINSVVSRDSNVLKCPVSGAVIVVWLGGYEHVVSPYSSVKTLKGFSSTSLFTYSTQDNFNYGSATANIPYTPGYYGQTAVYQLPGGSWATWKPDPLSSGSTKAAKNATFLYLYYASPDLTPSNGAQYTIAPPCVGTGDTTHWLKPLSKGSQRSTPITCMRHLLAIPAEVYKPVPDSSGTGANQLPAWTQRSRKMYDWIKARSEELRSLADELPPSSMGPAEKAL